MTFGELIDVLGKRLGVEIEDAGGAFALEIDGETVILQDAWRTSITFFPKSGRTSATRAGAVRTASAMKS